MYCSIKLSLAIAKLFEVVLVHQYEDQLSTDDPQYGFKKTTRLHSSTIYILPIIYYTTFQSFFRAVFIYLFLCFLC